MTRRYDSHVVSILGFSPILQDGNEVVSEPHNSSTLSLVALNILNIPPGANAILVQAITQNARYTLTPTSDPSPTSGFRLTAGNDPIIIPIDPQTTRIAFIAEAAGAILEAQFGRI